MRRWKEIALVALATGCLDPVVGGSCEEGYVVRDGRCALVDGGTADGNGQAIVPVRIPDGAVDEASPAEDAPAMGDDVIDAAQPEDRAVSAEDVATTDASEAGDTAATGDDAPIGDVAPASDTGTGSVDAGMEDSSLDDVPLAVDTETQDASGASADASGPDASTREDGAAADDAGLSADGGETDVMVACERPSVRCDRDCVDLQNDAYNCGACGARCGASEYCFAGTCAPICPSPFRACGSSCVDLSSDADNCGACGLTCASGVCSGGRCRVGRLGHLALIGHDYNVGREAQNTIVGNAVFMGASTAPRVLAMNTWTPVTSITHTLAAINQVAAGARRWSLRTVSDYTQIPAALSVDSTDVLIVYAQPQASEPELVNAARILGPAINSFVRSGGVAIVLDGEGTNAGTWQIASASGLIPVTGRSVVTGDTLTVENSTDALGVGLNFEYRAERTSVAFQGVTEGTVVSSARGAVVVHLGFPPRR